MVCLRFDHNGYGRIDTILNNFESTLQKELHKAVERSIGEIAPDILSLLVKKEEEIEETDLPNIEELTMLKNQMLNRTASGRNQSIKKKRSETDQRVFRTRLENCLNSRNDKQNLAKSLRVLH